MIDLIAFNFGANLHLAGETQRETGELLIFWEHEGAAWR